MPDLLPMRTFLVNASRPFSLLICLTVFLLLAPTVYAKNPPGMPPRGKIILGMGGHGATIDQFNKLTGANHQIHLVSPPWRWKNDGEEEMDLVLDTADDRYRVMFHMDAKDKKLTPLFVAKGGTDESLIGMSRSANLSEQFIYIRPPAEMNGHWSPWTAYKKNGSKRPAAYSTQNYRRAFIRITEVFRGGSVAGINKRLKANGMPPLKTKERILPRSNRVAMVWNPQAEGSPNVKGNQPIDYYPGRRWVDYVATDIYEQSGRAAWAQNEKFYKQFTKAHPFMIAEYAPWGYDGASFVAHSFAWAKSHPRTVALMYFNGTSNPAFVLKSKRKSLAVYKKQARDKKFSCPRFSVFSNNC